MTKVKICGITNLEDALVSAKFGADALGFNFYKKSPRYISPIRAREIIEQLPPKILKVGVFVNEDLEKITEISETAKLDAIQLHGEETPEFVIELKTKTNLEIIKAFRVSPEFKPENVLEYKADAILLDAFSRHEHGGTGETFDWEIAKKVQEIFPKMYLAGGLSQDNIASAVMKVKPFAVDACSCLEFSKGKKDRVTVINFMSNIKYITHKIYERQDFLSVLRGFCSRSIISFPGNSITHICIYIYGYLSGLTKVDFQQINGFLKEFESFEGIKRGMFIDGVILYYPNHFLQKSDGDERRASDIFFSRLEEFLLEKEDLSNE